MKKTLKTTLLLAIPLLLAACATNQNYDATIKSWVGANANSLYDVWGYPDRTKKWNNGHKLLVYRYHDKGRYPITTYPGSTSVVSKSDGSTQVYTSSPITTGGGTYNLICTTWFETNRRNIIVRATSRGNDCAATQRFMKNKSNPNG